MSPSLFVRGASIWTGDERKPRAEALWVEDGVFRAVGGEAYVASLCPKGARRVDAGGGLVVPGMTDAHIHLTAYCKQSLYLDLSGVRSLEGLLETLSKYIEKERGCRWIRAVNYNETTWDRPVSLTGELIDSVGRGRPVLLSRYDGHVHVANGRAMEEAALRESFDPNVERDADGRPTGVLREGAASSILTRIEDEYESGERIRELLADGCRRLASWGITAVHACDAPSYGLPEDIAALQDLREAGELPLRVISYHDAFPNLNFRSFLGDDHICYGGLKIFLDGSLGGHSAALREGYSDQPSVRGQLCHSDRELMEMLAEAQARKIQVQMHMIGDASIDQAIRVSKELLERTGKAPAYPLRFNHVIVSHPEQLDAMKSLGVVVDLQPIQAFTDREMAPERLGKKRMEGTYPFRRLYDAGLLVTGSSDAPIEHPNPWLGIWAAVCGTDEQGRLLRESKMDEVLTLEEALALYTRNPYRALRWNGGFGTIAEGAPADFAILEENPFEMDVQRLKKLRVRETYLAGTKTY